MEPGHDGVGDYTRVLAGELISRGIQAKIIALKDRSVNHHKLETQHTRGVEVEVTRLSRDLSIKEARKHYRGLVDSFNPEWLSLQYVPYAFSAKGLPFYLPGFLDVKHPSAKWHIMVHEAYIWDDVGIKLSLVGRLQQYILKKIINKINPRVLHTSIPWYAELVERVGPKPDILPLFGNIDIAHPSGNNASADFEIDGVFFGAGPKIESFQIFSDQINAFLVAADKKLNIVFCGKPDFRTSLFIAHLKEKVVHPQFRISIVGPQKAEKISLIFQSSHFGISREVPRLMGKSGAILAMYEHGLPIWVPLAASEIEIKENTFSANATFFLNIDELKYPNDKRPENGRLVEITSCFLTSLQ